MENLYLIGMMGCGKSTCGGLLSRRLARPLLDTDVEIEKSAGMTVSEIFAQQGEEAFRNLETALCRELAEREHLIVACGGGLPLRRENRELLRGGGLVVFLQRDPEAIFDSVDMGARPLGQQGKAAFLARYRDRLPLYQAAAHITLRDFSTPEATVEELCRILGENL